MQDMRTHVFFFGAGVTGLLCMIGCNAGHAKSRQPAQTRPTHVSFDRACRCFFAMHNWLLSRVFKDVEGAVMPSTEHNPAEHQRIAGMSLNWF